MTGSKPHTSHVYLILKKQDTTYYIGDNIIIDEKSKTRGKGTCQRAQSHGLNSGLSISITLLDSILSKLAREKGQEESHSKENTKADRSNKNVLAIAEI